MVPQQPALGRRTASVGAEIVAHFERQISSGELAPGARLPSERELALSLNVSRTSLREAMHELEVKNMVVRRPGRGTVVAEPGARATDLYERISAAERTLRDVAELRETIEPKFAELAAARITGATLLALETVLEKTRTPLSRAESIALDIEFHMLIAQASQNRLLVALGTLANEWTASTRALSHADSRARQLSHEGHQRIYLAVRERDPESARIAMLRHLSEVAELTRENHPSF
ncbi:FadR/GntR family transcriptional regulator [Nocardia sp. alder85J]|uniref:FadR/GntR family transcriptional regulator n=1 Tax=Nocardia sp. alder85J TaxID=2862949 RepID=UPI001CD657DF|nr:FadR/GntR family transcriptional regulator [Nocardia sp. alder85J]MCX4091724.1 FadR/GntR family transcriptional regulator [Nocardia sp. alder85J]